MPLLGPLRLTIPNQYVKIVESARTCIESGYALNEKDVTLLRIDATDNTLVRAATSCNTTKFQLRQHHGVERTRRREASHQLLEEELLTPSDHHS